MDMDLPQDADAPTRSTSGASGKMLVSLVHALGSAILGGQYRPEEALPREDELAARFGVGRGTVREAVKVLAAKGLVESRPRTGLKVSPRDAWRLLDPDVLSWHPDMRRDPELVNGLIEARRIIEPAAAEWAARRGSGADLAAIEGAFLAMQAALPDNREACCEADLAFHRAVIVASHNLVLKALAGTIEAALRAAFVATSGLMATQAKALEAHREVMERIRYRDAEGARLAMVHLLDIAAEDLEASDPPDFRPDRGGVKGS